MTNLKPGLTNTITNTVTTQHLASSMGSGLAPVLATPFLVALCEECARLSVDPFLPEGLQTVGTHIDLYHIAATPPGMQVTIEAELVEIEGQKLRFKVSARDEVEKIGYGEHERFIIDTERFSNRLAKKTL
ncbi:MAG: thioesterase family protein [Anaerolineales bacterium]|nr:thioesterase family protein [Anaerolineales bacterium]